jgi:hypothetical protein
MRGLIFIFTFLFHYDTTHSEEHTFSIFSFRALAIYFPAGLPLAFYPVADPLPSLCKFGAEDMVRDMGRTPHYLTNMRWSSLLWLDYLEALISRTQMHHRRT